MIGHPDRRSLVCRAAPAHVGVWLALLGSAAVTAADGAAGSAGAPAVRPAAALIRVPLPIAGEADNRVRGMVQQLLDRWPTAEPRPILVLQFGGSDETTGRGSQFERALALARFLAGPQLSRVRVVAYLTGTVEGHAVLPVLACEQIVAHPEAVLGRAGVDERFVDETMRRGYSEIAEGRRTIPVALALGMLDARLAVYKVQTLDGTRYVLEQELQQLQRQAAVRSVERAIPEGELGRFTGAALRLELGRASHLARDRRELATALGLPPGTIEEDPTLGQSRRAVAVELTGPIQTATINWIERSIREEIDTRRANFICLTIDSPGGAVTESTRLATYLASLSPSEVRTVAYVPSEARADAALIALACDELVMADNAVLGGPGVRRITPQRLDDLKTPVRELAQAKGRDWSLLLALVDPRVTVRRYDHAATAQPRYFCAEELAEQEAGADWRAGPELATATGINGTQAVQWQLVKVTANSFPDLRQLYELGSELETVRASWAHSVIEFLASPAVAGALLFIAWFALMIEFMSPGLSVAGLISAVSFLLYFWSHFLHGTAGWLEILLFAAGVACVLLEIFVVPGTGAFGIGGVVLIVASIALASQTFLIPRNAYEWGQVRTSLVLVVTGFAGAAAALMVMRRAFTDAPVFRRVSLETPDLQRRQEIQYQESLVHLDYLIGQRGVTTTPLMPSGKARFGDETVDVISDGDVIPSGAAVYVVGVQGNEVQVRAVDN
jgi:membrane-bound ClpP family serine protease